MPLRLSWLSTTILEDFWRTSLVSTWCVLTPPPSSCHHGGMPVNFLFYTRILWFVAADLPYLSIKGKLYPTLAEWGASQETLTAWKSSRWLLPRAPTNLYIFLMLLALKVWQRRKASSQSDKFHYCIALIIFISAHFIFLPYLLLLASCLVFLVLLQGCLSDYVARFTLHTFSNSEMTMLSSRLLLSTVNNNSSKLKWIGGKNHLFWGNLKITLDLILP